MIKTKTKNPKTIIDFRDNRKRNNFEFVWDIKIKKTQFRNKVTC